MGALASEVLAEAEPIHVDADALVPALGDAEEVSDPRRPDDFLVDGLTDGRLDIVAVIGVLFCCRVECDRYVFDVFQRRFVLFGIDELL